MGKKKSIQEQDLNVSQSIKHFWPVPCRNVQGVVETSSRAVGATPGGTPALSDVAPGALLDVLSRSRSCRTSWGPWELQDPQFPDLACSLGALFPLSDICRRRIVPDLPVYPDFPGAFKALVLLHSPSALQPVENSLQSLNIVFSYSSVLSDIPRSLSSVLVCEGGEPLVGFGEVLGILHGQDVLLAFLLGC